MSNNPESEGDDATEEAVPSPPPPPPPPTPRQQAQKELSDFSDGSDLPSPPPSQIPFDLVARHDKRTVQLLANSGNSSPMKGKRIWYTYDFEELVVLEEVIIDLSSYSEFSEFDFSFTTFDEKLEKLALRPKNGQIRQSLNLLVKSVSFRPPRGGFTTGYIQKVRLLGFALSSVSAFAEYTNSLMEKRSALASELGDKHKTVLEDLTALKKLQLERDSIVNQIANAKKSQAELEAELGKLRATRDETITRISSLDQSMRENDQKISDQKNEIGEVSEIRSKLARAIIEKQEKLRALTANINLFPSELSDFVAQGSRDVRVYALLSSIPVIVIAIMFGVLIKGGVDLTTLITAEEDVNILAMFASRLPFVVVAVTIITACYYLARMFILEMVRVNRQKLSLSKIGIIAKDISFSVTNELDLDEDERYARRLTLKMDMLRDHLKEYLSKDFEPTLPKRSPFEQLKIPGIGSLKTSKKDDSGEQSAESDESSEDAPNDEDESVPEHKS